MQINVDLKPITKSLNTTKNVIYCLTVHNLKAFYIDVSNNSDGSSAQQCTQDPVQFAPSETRVYACPCGMHGRYVRIRYPVNLRANMQLCEVQVQAGGKEILRSFVMSNGRLQSVWVYQYTSVPQHFSVIFDDIRSMSTPTNQSSGLKKLTTI